MFGDIQKCINKLLVTPNLNKALKQDVLPVDFSKALTRTNAVSNEMSYILLTFGTTTIFSAKMYFSCDLVNSVSFFKLILFLRIIQAGDQWTPFSKPLV